MKVSPNESSWSPQDENDDVDLAEVENHEEDDDRRRQCVDDGDDDDEGESNDDNCG